MNFNKLSIVIPCYNSEHTLQEVVLTAIKTIETRPELDYEIILVNDFSKDSTWTIIKQLASENNKIKGINFSKNYSQHNAGMAAYHYVTGDIIVGFDDDGEHDPKDMFLLVDKLINENYDIVYGVCENNKKKNSIYRNLGSKINNYMSYLLIDKPKNINVSSYYAIRRFIIDKIIECTNPFPYNLGLVLQTTHNIGEVTLQQHSRKYGRSGYSFFKLLKLWMNGFTAFSVKPLRIATLIGFITAFLGFCYGFVIIIEKIITPNLLIGYSSIMSVILFVGGILMILLGIIGEYVGRIYININKSPQYTIREKVNL